VRKNKKIALFIFLFFLKNFLSFAQDKGDAFVTGSIADARVLIPILASDSASAQVCDFIFNGLLKYDKDLNLVPDLAESFEVSKDKKVITFHLKKGVKWHDGKEFTSEDVLFTYKMLVSPQVPSPYSGDYELIEKIETPDKYTVKVYYKKPFSPALSSWTMGIIPAHLLKGKNLLESDFKRRPVGTGPYKFCLWKTQEKIILKRNSDYFKKPPYVEYVVFKVIGDTATLFLELITQNIDFAGLTPLQYIYHTKSSIFKKNFRKFEKPSLGYVYLGYNLRNPLFKDKRVRRALNLAVNKKRIIKTVLLGKGIICTGPFVPSQWAFNPKIKPAPYDPERAKKILKECGWQDTDSDGILEKDGKEFKFTIITNQGNLERQKTAELIKYDLEKIGIKVDIKVVEWSVFINEFINKRKFEAVLLGWGLSPEPDIYDIFHSSKTREGEFNFVGYKNKLVDKLLEKARQIFDVKIRKKIYQKVQKIIYEDQPYMFLYVPQSLFALHKRFRNVKLAKSGIFYNFEEWYVPLKEQRYKLVIKE